MGITLSPTQHALASSRIGPEERVTVRLGDWLENEFPDQSFDAAVALESTEHMDKPRSLAQAHRVLRAGGRLVICAWLAAENPRPWEVRYLLEPICREGRLPGLASESDYREVFEQCGFELERYEDLSAKVKRTWTICIRRSLARALTDRRVQRYLLSPRHVARNREFFLTIFRIRLAYATGAMRYGLFSARRPR